jgi:hypothetical protein
VKVVGTSLCRQRARGRAQRSSRVAARIGGEAAPVIEVRGLTRRFGGRTVLDRVLGQDQLARTAAEPPALTKGVPPGRHPFPSSVTRQAAAASLLRLVTR